LFVVLFQTLSFLKVWGNIRPNCLFNVTSSSDDVTPYFKCVVSVAQQESDADQRADVDVRYEVKKVSSFVLGFILEYPI